jgi:hypothetical protein
MKVSSSSKESQTLGRRIKADLRVLLVTAIKHEKPLSETFTVPVVRKGKVGE